MAVTKVFIEDAVTGMIGAEGSVRGRLVPASAALHFLAHIAAPYLDDSALRRFSTWASIQASISLSIQPTAFPPPRLICLGNVPALIRA
jgi:hypothetical protein